MTEIEKAFAEGVLEMTGKEFSSDGRSIEDAIALTKEGMHVNFPLLDIMAGLIAEGLGEGTDRIFSIMLSVLFPDISFTSDELKLIRFLSSEYDNTVLPYDIIIFCSGAAKIEAPDTALGLLIEKGIMKSDREDILLCEDYPPRRKL